MDYEQLWKVLEELITELMRKGVTVPQELVDDLKSAKTLISIYKVDPTAINVITDIELYIEKLESNLLYLAEADVGKEYADECIRRVNDARMELREEPFVPSKFVSGVPKGEHWIRIEATSLISDREIDKLLKKLDLSSKQQENGYLLIHGKEENVKAFIKQVAERIRKKKDV